MSNLNSRAPKAEGSGISQTDVVIQRIKAMITHGELTAGARLPVEKELAAELAVSRGSLREGVRALAIMGVLETRQGDGTYVTSLDPDVLLAAMGFMVDLQSPRNAVHLQSVRRVLETEAAGLAALLMTEDQLQAAAETLDRSAAAGEEDFDSAMDADIEFHRLIAQSSGNPVLAALIAALSSRTMRTRTYQVLTDGSALASAHISHSEILSELVARNPDGARVRMANHLLTIQEHMAAVAAEEEIEESGTN